MAAPATVKASGHYDATLGGAAAGPASLRMKDATRGSLELDGRAWRITADPATKRFRGTSSGSVIELKVVNGNLLRGTLDGDPVELSRAVLRPIPAAEMAKFDPGPKGALKTFMNSTPSYEVEVGDSTTFWYAFGNLLYRGRLDGSARVLCIASDPGPTECLPFMRRALVGDSGQKTQGFLAKLGLTRSYVLVNAFAVAMRPSEKTKGLKVLKNNAAIMAARHGLYDRLLGPNIEAVITFGDVADQAYLLWRAANPAVKKVPRVDLAHPAAVDRGGSGDDASLQGWARGVTKLRKIVTPDADGDAQGANYGAYITELDYQRIPRRDLPAVAPAYAGDDSWGRAASPRHNNCCSRPSPDDRESLLLTPAPGQGSFLRYHYRNGALLSAQDENGGNVPVDASGMPL